MNRTGAAGSREKSRHPKPDHGTSTESATPIPSFTGTSPLDTALSRFKTQHRHDAEEASPDSPFSATDQSFRPPPSVIHRMRNERSILALVVSSARIYAGTQGGEILIYSLETFESVGTIDGHRGSVLCLALCEEQNLLFSGAGDRIVNVWSIRDHSRVYSIFSDYDIGDVFCLAYSSSMRTVYLGAQNTSIQWYDLKDKDTRPCPTLVSHPYTRADRFFDSAGPGGIKAPRPSQGERSPLDAQGGQMLEIDKQHIHQFAHYGYVYCMILASNLSAFDHSEVLISGGGDGVIKLWALHGDDGGRIEEVASLDDGRQEGESVLTMSLDGSFLYAGRLDGEVNVWDLETKQLLRSINTGTGDVLTVSIGGGLLFVAGESGKVEKFGPHYETISSYEAHSGRILASSFVKSQGKPLHITGGNDNTVAVWDVQDCASVPATSQKTSNQRMVETLSQFVAHRTVSCDPKYSMACRRGASWLRSLMKAFGATTHMLGTEGALNPVILGIFKGHRDKAAQRKRILFYGHYDVITAKTGKGKWRTDPFSMTGVDGYLYGRGTSDNKGPIVAAIYAVAELAAEKMLDSDIVFLVEGEEECGSRGFEKTVRDNKALIGDIDWILLANSYWLDDHIPCLTYGLRGVVHATVRVESEHPDLHSGVDGSALLEESLKDLVMLLSKLMGPKGRIEIPRFYDPIPPLDAKEKQLYNHITRSLIRRQPELGDADTLATSLMRRWREAALTVHHFRTSGPENSTVIPRCAEASLSLRLVPNQNADDVSRDLKAFLDAQFAKLQSRNRLTVTIDHKAEPWLGDYTNEIFQTLEAAIMDVWGPLNVEGAEETASDKRADVDASLVLPSPTTSSTLAVRGRSSTQGPLSPSSSDQDLSTKAATVTKKRSLPSKFNDNASSSNKPLYIREGGSIPSIRFLEKEFGAPAAHLPCGQASDGAHLDNERLRVQNLFKSKDIFKWVFRELPKPKT